MKSIKQSYKLSTPTKNSNIALKYKLYVSGWLLSHELQYIRDNPKNNIVLLSYKNNEPVGVILLNSKNQIMIFVRKQYRNCGIGSKLMNRLFNKISDDRKRKIFAEVGIESSKLLFKKFNVRIKESL